jgi:hypothetical protein
MIYRGVFHAHSKHSYDGKVPLPKLCSELRCRGYHFLLLTEHDDTLDAAAYERICSECAEQSSPDFLVVPGIELRCWRSDREQRHIAALGVHEWIPRGPIPAVLAAIRRAGGLSVFLHPHKYSGYIEASELVGFDGFEFWNGKEDGPVAPRGKTARLARRLCTSGRGPMLYAGHDLHDLDCTAPLAIEVEADALNHEKLFDKLRTGEFTLHVRRFRIPASNGPSAVQLCVMGFSRAAYDTYRVLRRLPVIGSGLAAVRRWVLPSASDRNTTS